MGRIASVARTPAQGVMLVTFASAVACVINWGFGLVVGAMFAREVSRRHPEGRLPAADRIGLHRVHDLARRLLRLGPAGRGDQGQPDEDHRPDPHTDTLFTTFNIAITLALILVLPFVCRIMHPAPKDVIAVDPSLLRLEETTRHQLGPDATPAERIEEAPLLSFVVAAFGIVYLILYFQKSGFNINININTVNLIMLSPADRARTPMAYARAVSNAARGTAGIMIQFPFYAGIQLMMEEWASVG